MNEMPPTGSMDGFDRSSDGNRRALTVGGRKWPLNLRFAVIFLMASAAWGLLLLLVHLIAS